jgi:hypothetical protein
MRVVNVVNWAQAHQRRVPRPSAASGRPVVPEQLGGLRQLP